MKEWQYLSNKTWFFKVCKITLKPYLDDMKKMHSNSKTNFNPWQGQLCPFILSLQFCQWIWNWNWNAFFHALLILVIRSFKCPFYEEHSSYMMTLIPNLNSKDHQKHFCPSERTWRRKREEFRSGWVNTISKLKMKSWTANLFKVGEFMGKVFNWPTAGEKRGQ